MLLHRYQSLNKFTLENLILKKNWASNPIHFNDPFEFSLRNTYTVTSDGQIEYLSPAAIDVRNDIKRSISEFGVVSFAERDDDVLMWSHYASNHTGICLVFETGSKVPDNLHKVNYEITVPEIEFKDGTNFKDVLITKGKYWAYEKEHRQIFLKGDAHYEYPGTLTEIIFGCRTPFKDMKTIAEIGDVIFDNSILFSKMSLQSNTFYLSKGTTFRKKGQPLPKHWVI